MASEPNVNVLAERVEVAQRTLNKIEVQITTMQREFHDYQEAQLKQENRNLRAAIVGFVSIFGALLLNAPGKAWDAIAKVFGG